MYFEFGYHEKVKKIKKLRKQRNRKCKHKLREEAETEGNVKYGREIRKN